MDKERILIMIEKLLKIYEELDEDEEVSDLEENNIVEMIWVDEDGNWIYKFKN